MKNQTLDRLGLKEMVKRQTNPYLLQVMVDENEDWQQIWPVLVVGVR